MRGLVKQLCSDILRKTCFKFFKMAADVSKKIKAPDKKSIIWDPSAFFLGWIQEVLHHSHDPLRHFCRKSAVESTVLTKASGNVWKLVTNGTLFPVLPELMGSDVQPVGECKTGNCVGATVHPLGHQRVFIIKRLTYMEKD